MPLAKIMSSVLLMLCRRTSLVSAIFLGLGALTTAFIILSPPRYVARATVLAKFGREYAVKIDPNGNPLVQSNFGQDEIVNSVIEIMRTDQLATEIVQQVGATTLYPTLADSPGAGLSPDKAAQLRFVRDLSIAPSRRSNVVALELANVDPEVAAMALNKYVVAFQTKFLALYGESNLAFYEAELAEARRRLDEATQAATKLGQERGTYADAGQLERLLGQREQTLLSYSRVVVCCSETSSAKDLARQLAELDARIKVQFANQALLKDLNRQRELTQEGFDAAQRRLQEARQASNMDESRITSVQVVQTATPPVRPSQPSKTLKIVLGLFLSGLAAVTTGLLAELLQRRFSTASELRHAFAPIPVLGEVSGGH